jgi:outer membrane lipoprotein SlyB
MIADVRERLDRAPFVPFVVRTSDGHDYSVPTVDHAFITPKGNRVVVVADDGGVAVLGPIHISGIIDHPTPA